MHMITYIELYNMLDGEDDLEDLRKKAFYLLVDKCFQDPNTSKLESEAFAEFVSMNVTGEERVLH